MKHSFRSIFVPSPGCLFISIDLSQAETWIVAHLANEPRMKDALKNGDIHIQTASLAVYKTQLGDSYNLKSHPHWQTDIGKNQRYIGKKTNHAASYGEGPYRFVQTVNQESDETGITIGNLQGTSYMKAWHEFYYNIKEVFHKGIVDSLTRNQRVLETPYGRKRRFYNEWGDRLFKEAYAYIPQSSVADHAFGAIQNGINGVGGIRGIYQTFVRGTTQNRNTKIKICNTAHDSVLIEVPSENARDIGLECKNLMMRPLMVNGEVFTIPADLEIGDRLGENMEKVR